MSQFLIVSFEPVCLSGCHFPRAVSECKRPPPSFYFFFLLNPCEGFNVRIKGVYPNLSNT